MFAAFLVGSLRAARGDVNVALTKLGNLSLASLLLALGAVILTTVLTQAFQFEAIRLLEGYWGPGRIRSAIANVRCQRHLAKRNRLWVGMADLEKRAFGRAASRMLEEDIDPSIVDMVARVHRGELDPDDLTEPLRRDFDDHPWEEFAPTDLLRRIDAMAAAARRFPEDDRAIRPTRLGNTLRAYEDPVEAQIGRPIEAFVQDIFHELPLSLQTDHDQLRSRLDLYCSLVIVFSLCGVTAIGLLAGINAIQAALAGAVFALLVWLSYRAAVTSARAYGSILTAIAGASAPPGGTSRASA